MKLRNKKTGEIIEKMFGSSFVVNDGHRILTYYSLAELNEEWEDYKPKEPRINDEDARDAVFSWASALQIHRAICAKKTTPFGVEVITLEALDLRSAPKIEFSNIDADVANNVIYSITELCGEEE